MKMTSKENWNEWFLSRVIFTSDTTQRVCLPWVDMARSGVLCDHTQDLIRKHIQSLFILLDQCENQSEKDIYSTTISELNSLVAALPFYGEKVMCRRHNEDGWLEGICIKPRKLWIQYEGGCFDDENTIAEWKPNILPVIIKLDPKRLLMNL